MTTPLDIIISRTLTVPPATAMLAYRTAVNAAADVDAAGEYSTATNVVYLALMDSDDKLLPNLPVGSVLTMTTRTAFNTPTTVERTVTSYITSSTYVTVGLSDDPVTNRGAVEFTIDVPGSSDTATYWARRLDFTAANLAGGAGMGLVGYNDSRYRVRPDPTWEVGATFLDERGNERSVLSIAEVQERRFLELLARDIT